MMCLTGIIGAFFYTLHDFIGRYNYPGYKWLEQAVSDLTAVNAPSRIIAGGLKNHKRHLSLSVWAIIAFLCMLFGAVGTSIVPGAYFGLVERFSTYSAVLFTMILGIYGFAYFDKQEKINDSDRVEP
jgi:hypothetical protein